MKSVCKIIKIWSKTIAQDFVPVQPMAAPSPIIFDLEASYKIKNPKKPKTPTLNESRLKEIKL
jgi:hypothetical protein